jgi:hypothetical protein
MARDLSTARAAWRRLAAMWRATRRTLAGVRVQGGRLRWAGLIGGTLAASAAQAVDLPEDRTDALFHVYDGGGVRATGPALLVRKRVADKFSVTGQYYVDMVSNASIDVMTTASPFKETRKEYSASVDYAHRDAIITMGVSNSEEPDYTAKAFSLDVSQETFGGMTTVALGFTRASDEVRKKNEPGWLDTATHWRWRTSVTQIMSPRWLLTGSYEAVADEGFLGSPYRAARVFGALLPERNPRTRSSRALKFTSKHEIQPGHAVHGEYRYFWDNWDIKAHTAEVGYSRYFGEQWLADFHLRLHSQNKALFYSDNAQQETLYVSRNRQLSTFTTTNLGGQATYRLSQPVGPFQAKLSAAYELMRFNFKDFTDLRTGAPYRHSAHLLQLFVTATF